MRHILTALRRFKRSERASISVEAVFALPMLLFAYVGLFTYFDAYRTLNLNIRGSYSVADMLSRETNFITPEYMEGLNKIVAILTKSKDPTILRVTVVTYDADASEYQLVWSAVNGGSGAYITPVTEGTMDQIRQYIPVMAHGDINVVVQTWASYVPMMKFGLPAQYFESLVVTRPRFAPQLLYSLDGVTPTT